VKITEKLCEIFSVASRANKNSKSSKSALLKAVYINCIIKCRQIDQFENVKW